MDPQRRGALLPFFITECAVAVHSRLNVRALVNLRPAVTEDAEAIGYIRVSAWRAAYRQFMPPHYLGALDPSTNLEALRQRLANPIDPFRVTVAERSGSVVGFSIVGAPRYESSNEAVELWALNVLPKYWRQGIGCALTCEAIDRVLARGFSAVELWCIHGNTPAQAAYESCGFKLTGQNRTSSALTGHPLYEVLYAKAL